MAERERSRSRTSGRCPKGWRPAPGHDIKAFAGKTLPTIEEHLKMLRDLQKEVGVAATGN